MQLIRPAAASLPLLSALSALAVRVDLPSGYRGYSCGWNIVSTSLRRGAGLVAISQVLRHRDLATTALYAKVDFATLRRVAQPWPGTAR